MRVVLPYPLRVLAKVEKEVGVEVRGTVTVASVLDALEGAYPVLKGAMRDHAAADGRAGERRAMVRFFVCNEDVSLEPMDKELPAAVAEGREAFYVIGAIAGG